MIELILYENVYKQDLIPRIADFFRYHKSLLNGKTELDESSYIEAEKDLSDWIVTDHEMYIIKYKDVIAGFIHVCCRGGNVVWIEDIYVDSDKRNMGIATNVIKKIEEIIKSKPKYTAVCIDVVPRNEKALHLYHKLGYDSLSIITIRKELYENKRDRTEKILDLDFKV